MIVGRVTEKLEVPHEPSNFITIRELSGLEMDEAEEAKTIKVMRKFGSLGAETLSALRGEQAVQPPDSTQQQDPKDEYDWEYLVCKAIVDWSGPNYDGTPINDEHKRRLDKVTLEWLVGVIVERNTVPLGT